ncbi:hypothetical protein [Haliangium ochraceum]|uniref:Uncharacterized protein n=1 Tax=Haliangium ochraceum (strain DSM 14365 / JCM 11303 / SMP-2) TaxID=502025 RepID=D0LNB4_HALO1|nr:hypothetical protein [Haliangium ochraceum]ACY15291.1 hypothetical protein Hoch_2763 [Haliangium ochraceum DSM 14365]
MHDVTALSGDSRASVARSKRSPLRRTLAAALSTTAAAAFFSVTLGACLGGDGKQDPDAAPPAADAGPTPDSSNIDAGALPELQPVSPEPACVSAMEGAPTGGDAPSFADALPTATSNTWDGASIPEVDDADYPGGKYRTLTADTEGDIHPGCSTAGLSYTAASIEGFACAAKEYPFPSGVEEDKSKPIVILVHGNSDAPSEWEPFLHPDPDSLEFPADEEAARDQLSTTLPAAGFRTISVDLRIDLVDDPTGQGGNAARNIDHGWAVPIAQSLIKQVIINNPNRRVSVVGFSLGATIIRDALRRLFVEYQDGEWDTNIFFHVKDVVAAAGGHHGVSTYDLLCGNSTLMNGTAACEFGSRANYVQVPFHEPLNGPKIPDTTDDLFGGWYESPCADGSYAYGIEDACGGHAVEYTTITMEDPEDGQLQDEFVSEHAAHLYPEACVNNTLVGLDDFDTSGYFLNGLFRNHYGAIRSSAAVAQITAELGD